MTICVSTYKHYTTKCNYFTSQKEKKNIMSENSQVKIAIYVGDWEWNLDAPAISLLRTDFSTGLQSLRRPI